MNSTHHNRTSSSRSTIESTKAQPSAKSAQSHLPSSDQVQNNPQSSSEPSNEINSSSSPQISRNQPASRPLACGRRRRHTISNNHIEFMFYHCLRDDIDEEDEEEHDEEDEDDDDSSYHRISPRRQDQSLFDIHHCDVIVLKTDNGWCFDQDIFLPAWKRDAYEAAGQEDGFSGQELVKVDEIRVD